MTVPSDRSRVDSWHTQGNRQRYGKTEPGLHRLGEERGRMGKPHPMIRNSGSKTPRDGQQGEFH